MENAQSNQTETSSKLLEHAVGLETYLKNHIIGQDSLVANLSNPKTDQEELFFFSGPPEWGKPNPSEPPLNTCMAALTKTFCDWICPNFPARPEKKP